MQQVVDTAGQEGGRETETVLEVVEAPDAVERVAKDHECPSLSEVLERSRHRAVEIVVAVGTRLAGCCRCHVDIIYEWVAFRNGLCHSGLYIETH